MSASDATVEGDAVRRRTVTTWMVGALVAAGLVATDGAPEPVVGPVVEAQIEQVAAKPRLVVLQQNVDGSRDRFDKALAAAEAEGAHAVILQEVCRSWLDSVPGTWTPHYAMTKKGATANPCPAPHPDKGVLVAWTRPVTAESRKTFLLKKERLDKSRRPALACLHVESGGDYSVCGTHLVAFNELPCLKNPKKTCKQGAPKIRRQQAKEIRNRLNKLIPARRVILGGDFNTIPKDRAMSYLYARPTKDSKKGKFTEATQLGAKAKDRRKGAHTVKGRKIDYLFFSKNFVPFRHRGSLELEFVPASVPDGTIKKGHARLIARVTIGEAIPSPLAPNAT